MTLLHLALAKDWNPQAATYPMSTRGLTIAEVGFLHASRDEDQAERVARLLYADVTEPLLVLTLSEEALAAAGREVRFEPADPGNPDSERFPHVYGGDLPTSAVVDVRPFTLPT